MNDYVQDIGEYEKRFHSSSSNVKPFFCIFGSPIKKKSSPKEESPSKSKFSPSKINNCQIFRSIRGKKKKKQITIDSVILEESKIPLLPPPRKKRSKKERKRLEQRRREREARKRRQETSRWQEKLIINNTSPHRHFIARDNLYVYNERGESTPYSVAVDNHNYHIVTQRLNSLSLKDTKPYDDKPKEVIIFLEKTMSTASTFDTNSSTTEEITFAESVEQVKDKKEKYKSPAYNEFPFWIAEEEKITNNEWHAEEDDEKYSKESSIKHFIFSNIDVEEPCDEEVMSENDSSSEEEVDSEEEEGEDSEEEEEEEKLSEGEEEVELEGEGVKDKEECNLEYNEKDKDEVEDKKEEKVDESKEDEEHEEQEEEAFYLQKYNTDNDVRDLYCSSASSSYSEIDQDEFQINIIEECSVEDEEKIKEATDDSSSASQHSQFSSLALKSKHEHLKAAKKEVRQHTSRSSPGSIDLEAEAFRMLKQKYLGNKTEENLKLGAKQENYESGKEADLYQYESRSNSMSDKDRLDSSFITTETLKSYAENVFGVKLRPVVRD